MKLIATMPVRNEAWILGLSARVALMWCDEICIGNHASTDATGDILGDLQAQFPGRVHVVSFPHGIWTEMQHRETLLEMARNHHATHIAIVDADEVLTGDIEKLSPGRIEGGVILQLPLYNMRGSIDRFHVNGIWGKRWGSIMFEDDPRLHWWKPSRGAEYQHHKREPRGAPLEQYKPVSQGNGGIMHLWGVTERRLIAKHALYKMRDRIEYPDRPVVQIETEYSWSVKGRPPHDMPENWRYQKAPADWWAPYAHLMKYLDLDAVPWQEAECRRLMDWHGKQAFAGLDLFGVV
jgi:Glycosyl transferase family 2